MTLDDGVSKKTRDGMNTTRHGRRLAPLFVGALIGLALVVVGTMIPSPYIIEKPGPVVNTLGEIMIEGKAHSVVRIDGEAPNSAGVLNLLTVSIVGSPDNRLGWLELIPAVFDKKQEIVPIEQVFPQGETAAARAEVNEGLMQSSQTTAIAAALNEVGEDVDVTVSVEKVLEGSRAEGILTAEDVMIAINREPVTGTTMVRETVGMNPVGMPMEFSVIRDGKTIVLEVIPEYVEKEKRSIIGVVMGTDYEFQQDIDIDVDRIGGPSAGMIFSIAIVEELLPEDLVGEQVVSGTGTIGPDGSVGPIGGLPQKMWAAAGAGSSLFLMPLENCQHLPAQRPADMDIVPVKTLKEATNAIRNARDGKANVGAERCEREYAQPTRVG